MPDPKISLNKLGEYLDATPARRRRIVQDQQSPQAFVVTRYGDAREEIVDYIEGGMVAEEQLLEAATGLRTEPTASEFTRQDKLASADAIEDFLDAADKLEIDGLSAEGSDKSTSAVMEIAGVSVSVRPDVILKDPASGEVVGAVKLHFSKTNPLSEKSREYVATTLRVYLTETGNAHVDHTKCLVVDVPSQQVSHAPKGYKRKMNDIEAACEEIAARWTHLEG